LFSLVLCYRFRYGAKFYPFFRKLFCYRLGTLFNLLGPPPKQSGCYSFLNAFRQAYLSPLFVLGIHFFPRISHLHSSSSILRWSFPLFSFPLPDFFCRNPQKRMRVFFSVLFSWYRDRPQDRDFAVARNSPPFCDAGV